MKDRTCSNVGAPHSPSMPVVNSILLHLSKFSSTPSLALEYNKKLQQRKLRAHSHYHSMTPRSQNGQLRCWGSSSSEQAQTSSCRRFPWKIYPTPDPLSSSQADIHHLWNHQWLKHRGKIVIHIHPPYRTIAYLQCPELAHSRRRYAWQDSLWILRERPRV